MTLDELEKLCNEATPGPWIDAGYDSLTTAYGESEGLPPHVNCASDLDARFIAAARTLLPKLLEVAKAAKGMKQFGSDYRNGTHATLLWKALAALEVE